MEFFHKILEKRLSVTLPKHGLLRDLIIQFSSLGVKSSLFLTYELIAQFSHICISYHAHTSVT